MYSYFMIVRLHRRRDRGWPIPKYQFAFKEPLVGELTIHEARDEVLNRHTRIARLWHPTTGLLLEIPPLLDAQVVGLTRELLSLSGIERIEDPVLSKVEDFAQTWLCWLE